MFGICDTFMPLIYGKRENAQERLAQVLSAKYGGKPTSYAEPLAKRATKSTLRVDDTASISMANSACGSASAACTSDNYSHLPQAQTSSNSARGSRKSHQVDHYDAFPGQAWYDNLAAYTLAADRILPKWLEDVSSWRLAGPHKTVDQRLNPGTRRRIDTYNTARKKSRIGMCPFPRCERKAKDADDAKEHILSHMKPFKCLEPDCSQLEGFTTLHNLDEHRERVHHLEPQSSSNRIYVCSICPRVAGREAKSWTRKDNYRAHMQRMHSRHGADRIAVDPQPFRLSDQPRSEPEAVHCTDLAIILDEPTSALPSVIDEEAVQDFDWDRYLPDNHT